MSAIVYVAFAMLFVVCIVLNILAWRVATRLLDWAQGRLHEIQHSMEAE